MNPLSTQIQNITEQLAPHVNQRPELAIIVGSGLADLVQSVDIQEQVSFKQLNGMPASTAPSHQGEFLFGTLQNRSVMICQGRLHLYEGYSAQQVCLPTYIAAQLGAKQLIITNASGALNASYSPGEVMLIEDHINFTGHNPLVGQDDSRGTRFVDMSNPYDQTLATHAAKIAHKHSLTLHQGNYAGVLGPSLETSAERRMLAQWGADAVGMSTVLEVIAANHCEMQVLGLSAICNMAVGDEDQQADTIEEVIANAAIAGRSIKTIIEGMCVQMNG